jgi:hypothetical protein
MKGIYNEKTKEWRYDEPSECTFEWNSTNFSLFKSFALDHYNLFKEASEVKKNRQSAPFKVEEGIKTVLFCSFAIESLINHSGAEKEIEWDKEERNIGGRCIEGKDGKKYYIGGGSAVKKASHLVEKYHNDKFISWRSKYTGDLKSLFKLRNEIVHDKKKTRQDVIDATNMDEALKNSCYSEMDLQIIKDTDKFYNFFDSFYKDFISMFGCPISTGSGTIT